MIFKPFLGEGVPGKKLGLQALAAAKEERQAIRGDEEQEQE